MKKIILLTSFIILTTAQFVHAQCPVMPVGTLCLTQEQANIAAANTRELGAVKAENQTLKDSLDSKDKTIADLKGTNQKNVADLTERLTKTQTDLATVTGTVIAQDKELNRNAAIMDIMLKHVGKHCSAFSVLCL